MYFSPGPIVVTAVKSRRIKLVGQITHSEQLEMRTKFWSKNLKGRYNLGDLDVEDRII